MQGMYGRFAGVVEMDLAKMGVLKSALIVAAALLAVVFAITPLTALAQKPTGAGNGGFEPGEVLVKFKPVVGTQSGRQRLQREGAKILQTLPRSGLMRLAVTPGSEQPAIAALLARGDVEFATVNHLVETMEQPNDPYYTQQWPLDKIQAPAAWDINHGEATITIAIIDTGVDLDHPDLAGKLWANSDEIPGNGVDDDGNGYVDDYHGYDFFNGDAAPDDDNSHGSHVAGIAAASTNDSVGIAGVSWGAKIMPLKVLGSNGGGSTADVAEAIYYAVDNGASVINMSLGSSGSSWPCYWYDVEDAFNYAVNHNVLLVVAAGNDGKDGVSCPGAYDQAFAVGSTDSSDSRSYFSNYGSRLDIVAPGSSIYSTWSGGSYGYKSGTSMATPHVAGLAALVWGVNPGFTAAQVREIIQTSANDLGSTGWDNYFGYGRINAYRALLSFLVLTDAAGESISQPVVFLADAQTSPAPAQYTMGISTPVTGVISWTAAISPTTDWLTISAAAGVVSAASATQINLEASRPATYGVYTTTVVVTGTTATGLTVGPTSQEVRLSYVPQLTRLIFPLLFKN